MTEQMTMNRVIHGAVRRDLDRLAAALTTAAPGDTARARELARAYAHLHAQLRHHHEQEDRLIFPALDRLGIDTSLVTEMEEEHHAMAEALARTASVMQQYAETGSAQDAAGARESVEATRVVVERHLRHEEDELEPLIFPHQETAEWKQVEKELRKAPLRSAGGMFSWLTDGMQPEHRAFLREEVPRPVVAVLCTVFGRAYRREIAPIWRHA